LQECSAYDCKVLLASCWDVRDGIAADWSIPNAVSCDLTIACLVGAQKALLPGDSEVQQLLHTFQLLGTPNEDIWPGLSQLKVRNGVSDLEPPCTALRKMSCLICSPDA
jgi:hypothetical protein